MHGGDPVKTLPVTLSWMMQVGVAKTIELPPLLLALAIGAFFLSSSPTTVAQRVIFELHG